MMRFAGDIATEAMVTPGRSQYESVGPRPYLSRVLPGT